MELVRRNKKEELEEARDVFRTLELPGWKESGGDLGAGGQATVFTVERNDGTKGAFRNLKSIKTKDIDRFNREIRILTDLYRVRPYETL